MKTVILWMAAAAAVPALARESISMTATVEGFKLQTCTVEASCVRIESPLAKQGNFGLLTLDEVRVLLTHGKSVRTIEGKDAVYDPRAQSLQIRKVTKGPAKEMIVHMDSGKIQLF